MLLTEKILGTVAPATLTKSGIGCIACDVHLAVLFAHLASHSCLQIIKGELNLHSLAEPGAVRLRMLVLTQGAYGELAVYADGKVFGMRDTYMLVGFIWGFSITAWCWSALYR